MSKTEGRAHDPSRVNLCPQCATEALPTPAGIAYHRARHLEWHARFGPPQGRPTDNNRANAWRSYANALGDVIAHLNDEVGKRDDMILERDGYIADLEADLLHVRDELADANARLSEVRL